MIKIPVRVGRHGNLFIPKPIRMALNIKQGDVLLASLSRNEKITIERMTENDATVLEGHKENPEP